jgi:threonine/homoserine/homoserine lactone efflux protein
MHTHTYLQGLLIGFSIAAPVGPIGLICIRSSLTSGRLSGLTAGLGAATADALYGIVAGFGITIISGFLLEQSIWLRIFGGAFLCYLGFKTILTRPAHLDFKVLRRSLLRTYGTTFILTLTNPITILSFAAIFAGLGIPVNENEIISSLLLVSGVFCGSALWWLFLSSSVSLLKIYFNIRTFSWLNRLTGSVFFGFGIYVLSSLL